MKWRLLLLPTFKIRGGNKGGTLKSSNIDCLFTYMVDSGNEFELVGSSEYSVLSVRLVQNILSLRSVSDTLFDMVLGPDSQCEVHSGRGSSWSPMLPENIGCSPDVPLASATATTYSHNAALSRETLSHFQKHSVLGAPHTCGFYAQLNAQRSSGCAVFDYFL